MMTQIKGLAGSAGCVVGQVVVIHAAKLELSSRTITDADAEIASLKSARTRYNDSLGQLVQQARTDGREESCAIFEAYQEIAQDDSFFGQIEDLIREEMICAACAIERKRAETEAVFLSVDDPYLQARAQDINNVCKEVTCEMQGICMDDPFAGVNGDRLVVFAEDLTPADTVRLDRSRLAGMVTERGGVTSHTVILAKTLGIPAIVGTGPMLDTITAGQTVLVDGDQGMAIVCPDKEQEEAFSKRMAAADRQKAVFDGCRGARAVTRDGVPVQVNINSGDREGMDAFEPQYCDGIGLFRTEFLYMGQSDYPTEDFQFEVYKEMAEKNQGRELIIRTLDIGGDKQLDYMDLPQESNPFLGYRAIRLCLDRTDVFKTQLRAILRATVFGQVKIMFPMIVNLEELLRAKELLRDAMKELDDRGEAYNQDVKVGIMIETPGAVLLSDILAQHVDFFSIGSNDLIQYTTATDRMNERVQYLYDSCNISFLRSIKLVCEHAHAHGVYVGICGETASEPRLIPLWCAMGVDELSVAPALVGRTKYIVGQISAAEVQEDMHTILKQGSISAARSCLDEILGRIEL